MVSLVAHSAIQGLVTGFDAQVVAGVDPSGEGLHVVAS